MPNLGAEITVEGVDSLVLRYIAGDAVAETLLISGMEESLLLANDNVGVYPPETDANQPPPPYYIRGTGTQYATYNRNESQKLGQTWGMEIAKENTEVIGTIKPTATYAPYVHGTQSQIGRHANTGWRKVTEIATEITPAIQAIFDNVAKLFAAFLSGG